MDCWSTELHQNLLKCIFFWERCLNNQQNASISPASFYGLIPHIQQKSWKKGWWGENLPWIFPPLLAVFSTHHKMKSTSIFVGHKESRDAHGMPKTCCGLQVTDIPGIPISYIFMGQGGGHGKAGFRDRKQILDPEKGERVRRGKATKQLSEGSTLLRKLLSVTIG